MLQGLYDRLMEAAPQLLSRAAPAADDAAAGGDAEAAALYLAWLLDAVQAGVAYVSTTGARQVSCSLMACCEPCAAGPIKAD